MASPFEIKFTRSSMADLKMRLRNTRWPSQLCDLETGWEYGTDLSVMKRLVHYWMTDYDWEHQQKYINATFPQYTMSVSGLCTHFVHKRSSNPRAKVLVITHGWPGSFFEFHKIVSPLTEPQNYGGHVSDAFHVVAPSMPGYAFSEAPDKRGFDTADVARVVHQLMLQLGYTEYFAQGGDWGSLVSRNLGALFPHHCKGVHMNMPLARMSSAALAKTIDVAKLSLREQQDVKDMARFAVEETGYQKIQATKPQTLSYGLSDSPVGLCAWIVEKFRAWSDCDGDVLSIFTMDELLNNVMIYWISNSISSSVRLYYESMPTMPGTQNNSGVRLINTYVSVPCGCAAFPRELSKPPRSAVALNCNLVHWREFQKGGHFAALEQPQALVEDIRHFFHYVVPNSTQKFRPSSL